MEEHNEILTPAEWLNKWHRGWESQEIDIEAVIELMNQYATFVAARVARNTQHRAAEIAVGICREIDNRMIEKYHPAARQPRTLTARLVEAGLYSSIQSARPVVLREPDFATITVDLSGTWVDPEGQAHRVEVKGVAVEVTPAKYLK